MSNKEDVRFVIKKQAIFVINAVFPCMQKIAFITTYSPVVFEKLVLLMLPRHLGLVLKVRYREKEKEKEKEKEEEKEKERETRRERERKRRGERKREDN
nr:unnamed protein product [Callosobruchus chinensis]